MNWANDFFLVCLCVVVVVVFFALSFRLSFSTINFLYLVYLFIDWLIDFSTKVILLTVRKVVRSRRITRIHELPWATQLLKHFLTKGDEPFAWETKVGSARRVTRPAGSPLCDGRVTLLPGQTFLHINTLARPGGSTRWRWDNQSMRGSCFRQ